MTASVYGSDVGCHSGNESRCCKQECSENASYSGLFSSFSRLSLYFFSSFLGLCLSVGECLLRFFHFRLSFGAQGLNALNGLVHSRLGVILTKSRPRGDLVCEPSAVSVRNFASTKKVSQNAAYLTLEIRQVLCFLTGHRASLGVCAQQAICKIV